MSKTKKKTTKRTEILWVRHYKKNGFVFGSDHSLYRDQSDYTIRKVVRYDVPGHLGKPRVDYQVSVSPKRRSWLPWKGLTFAQAKRLAGTYL